jgi:hypothetical protein
VRSTENIETDRGRLPLVVQPLEIVRHPSQMAVGHVRNAAAYREAAVGELVRQTKHDTALQCLAEGRRPPGPETQPHGRRCRSEVERKAIWMLREASRETPQQPRCRRPQHAEPERFDVARSRIVPVVVDERIDPLADVDEHTGFDITRSSAGHVIVDWTRGTADF